MARAQRPGRTNKRPKTDRRGKSRAASTKPQNLANITNPPNMPNRTCDILIQAGHENTQDGATGGGGPLGDEIDWTPIVANEAVAILRAAGVDAVKEDASIKHSDRIYSCKLATFVH